MAAVAADRRAPPPKFEAGQFKGVFYDDVKQGLQGNRPAAGELRGAAGAGSNGAAGGGMANGSGAGGNTKAPGPAAVADAAGGWGAIIKPASLEDEIKRLKLRFDTTISTPAAFKSGGFEDARRDLSALAMLFQVIAQHPDKCVGKIVLQLLVTFWRERRQTAKPVARRCSMRQSCGSKTCKI